VDSQSGFFLSFMEKHHLVDIEPVKLVPTWHNFRIDKEEVAKRLDCFMAIEAFMAVGLLMNSMASTRKKLAIKRLLLNLNPDVVLIQKTLCSGEKAKGLWLEEEDFISLVKETWKHLDSLFYYLLNEPLCRRTSSRLKGPLRNG
jgi:hypothetical protein